MTFSQPLRVGRLPFLVCAPFFHTSLTGADGVQFVDGVPSQLNAELQAGRIDCAPSSSFEYGLHFRDYLLFPDISTSSRMEMKSVLFLSHLPWEEMHGQAVALSPDSATSNVLFRILCARRFKVEPKFLADRQAPQVSAEELGAIGQVFIGDRALQESTSGKWPYRYDLAEVWAKWHELPFSFGLWMVRREALGEKADLVRRFHGLLEASLNAFRSDPSRALDAWTQAYPSALPRSLMLGFYATADYGFSPEHAKSLDIFYRLAHEEGYLPTIPILEYFQVG